MKHFGTLKYYYTVPQQVDILTVVHLHMDQISRTKSLFSR